MGWAVKLDKGDFAGRERPGGLRRTTPGLLASVSSSKPSGSPAKGLSCSRGRRAGRRGDLGNVFADPEVSLAMALVDPAAAAIGTPLTVDVRGHREPAHVVKLPFYKRRANGSGRLITVALQSVRNSDFNQDSALDEDHRFMDLKTLRFAPTHEWVHLAGQRRDGRHQQVRRRSVDRPDHDRAAGRRDPGRARQELRRNRERQGGQRPVRSAWRARSSRSTARSPNNVQLLAEDPYDKGWLIKIKVDQPVDTSGLLDLDAYEAKVAEEGH